MVASQGAQPLMDDIIHSILSHSTISSMATMTQVSSRTRLISLPHLLRSIRLSRDGLQAHSFFDFILKNENFGRWVMDLEIFLYGDALYKRKKRQQDPFAQNWPAMLAEAMDLMPNLRRFHLDRMEENVARIVPSFGNTLLGLQQLQSLTLSGVLGKSLTSLGSAASSPTSTAIPQVLASLSIAYHEPKLGITDGNGLGRFLQLFSSQLTYLQLTGTSDPGATTKVRIIGTYPLVTELRVWGVCATLDTLSTSFPNVQNLNVGDIDLTLASDARNIFPRLLSLEGTYADVYTILLSKRFEGKGLRKLRLDEAWMGGSAEDAFAALAAVPNLKELDIVGGEPCPKPLSWWRKVANLLPTLKVLGLSLVVGTPGERSFLVSRLSSSILF